MIYESINTYQNKINNLNNLLAKNQNINNKPVKYIDSINNNKT